MKTKKNFLVLLLAFASCPVFLATQVYAQSSQYMGVCGYTVPVSHISYASTDVSLEEGTIAAQHRSGFSHAEHCLFGSDYALVVFMNSGAVYARVYKYSSDSTGYGKPIAGKPPAPR